MSKFPVEKKLDLSFLGSNWQGAEIIVSGLTFLDRQALAEVNLDEMSKEDSDKYIVDFLKTHFVRGTAWNGNALAELAPEDLVELPPEISDELVNLLLASSVPSPKS